MFIDDMKNRYTYVDNAKTIIHEQPIDMDYDPNKVLSVMPRMRDLLDKLSKARPTWRYKATGYPSAELSDLDIYDGDEKLGRVWVDRDWRTYEHRFYFENFRLKRARVRNKANYTTKPEVAVRRIIKAFHLKTPKERAAEAYNAVGDAVRAAADAARWPARRAKDLVDEKLFQYACEHWDDIKPYLGTAATNLDLPGLLRESNLAASMHAAHTGGKGVYVRAEPNDTYLVARRVSDVYETQSMTDDTLTHHLRGAIGLLKLMDAGCRIDGVGMRVNRNLYFVLDEASNV